VPELSVCGNCIDDGDLQEVVELNRTSGKCSFCGRRSKNPIAAELETVVEHIRLCIEEDYDFAANVLSYDGKEGGYQGDYWTTEELLTEEIGLAFPNDRNGKLVQAIVDLMPDELWCDRDPGSLGSQEEIRYNWESFCDLVKHKRRYFFLERQPKRFSWMTERDEPMPPAAVLDRIVKYAEECRLFRTYPRGSVFFRARKQRRGKRLQTPEDLGPPPDHLATKPNRMSPAGIAMLYASMSEATAISEILSGPGTYVVGKFRTLKPLLLLDLSALERPPGYFHRVSETAEYDPKDALRFLNALSWNISQPIEKDGRESIEYVPTQVVTEFIRYKRLSSTATADGIIYKSATDEGFSVVLFAGQENVQDTSALERHMEQFRDPWIELAGVSAFQRKPA
jgi:hypothetical protein